MLDKKTISTNPRARPVSEALEELRRQVEHPVHRSEPRHLRLRTALLEMFSHGYWGPGDRLPAERDIAQAIGLSLGTVQKSLAHLTTEGVLIRRQGHGTFVAGTTDQIKHFRFFNDAGDILAPVYAEAIDRKLIRSTGPWATFLSSSKSFICIRRMINIGNCFNCVSDFYLDGARFAKIMDMPIHDLHRVVIREFISKRFDAPALFTRKFVYATHFDNSVATLLKLKSNEKFGLVVEICSSSHRREPVSFQHIFVPLNAKKLEVPIEA